MINRAALFAEDMRKLTKSLYLQAKKKGDAYDEQYYLGRMQSAKMIRDFLQGKGPIANRKPETKK